MDLKNQQRTLKKVYEIYDDVIKDQVLACQPGCDTCCSQNVTATFNEASRAMALLEGGTHPGWKDLLVRKEGESRFAPVLTTNQMAARCMAGDDLPPEENHAGQDKCPFLKEHLCTIYENRPFGCRCFVSARNCASAGTAEMDPFIFTANTVFLQFLEHLDRSGGFGNFLDVLAFLASGDNAAGYADKRLPSPLPAPLLPNRAIPVLLVPPEHQTRIRPVLEALQGIL